MAKNLHQENARSFEIVGNSQPTARLRAEIARVAPYDSNVLVTGPSGSGKELVARNIHSLSLRANEFFIPVDCASLFGELMASQLFGHVAGAFTGATYAALGCFRAADRGTIFLDEIGELELSLQARLLRTIQERVVIPVGSHEGISIHVRIIAATNRDLLQEVREGRFREDLYYRLNVVSIKTEPLQNRRDDIPELAARFLESLATHGLPMRRLSPGAIEALQDYQWPGNVRQLKNFLEQAVIHSDAKILTLPFVLDLLQQVTGDHCFASTFEAPAPERRLDEPAQEAAPKVPPLNCDWPTLADLQREHLLLTLEHTYYNQSAAARLLGIGRQSLIRLMRKYDIEVPELPGKTRRKQ